jgi:nucleoside phosphorylase/Leucine-rich repeat (LRR) protein
MSRQPHHRFSAEAFSDTMLDHVATRAYDVMLMEAGHGPKSISLSDLPGVIDQALVERWRQLTLLGPDEVQSEAPAAAHTYYLREPLGPLVRLVGMLTNLTSLDLRGNNIGDHEHELSALAKLQELTSLTLSSNRIGDVSVRFLASLTTLSSLDLRDNRIGADGARQVAMLTQLTSLDLSSNEIEDSGARALSLLSQLTSLNLANNRIGPRGTHALSLLSELISLDMSRNRICDEGARALAALSSLDSLWISGNQIGPVGTQMLARLGALTTLGLSSNPIKAIGASSLSAIPGLSTLSLQDAEVGPDGARALTTLSKLTYLDLNNNRLGDVGTSALVEFSSLRTLRLRFNQIGDDGAEALVVLTNLDDLDLSYNRIGLTGARALLDAWSEIRNTSRRGIDLSYNRDIRSLLPLGDLESQDPRSLFAAYRRYREAKRQNTLHPLNEAKLVVVGNEAVGKTSLIRYLVHGLPRNPDERKTPGTAIHEKIEVSSWSVQQPQVRLNVWDFGGQEIMRGTHRFFLTERSLYLLVLEDRREDDRSIYDWLQIIAQRGGDSPVIVVVNKSEGAVPQLLLDEAALGRQYPVIAGFARTSCNTGAIAASSIAMLRTKIATTLNDSSRLQHVRDPIPQSWLRVKDAIAKLANERSVLPLRDFERLCEGSADASPSDRIVSPDEQRAVLGLMHDLGVVVAYGLRSDAPAVRKEITILDPNWLTGAIYALINSPIVREQGGELHHDQVTALLDPTRFPSRWHELILSMMQEPEIGLCFPIMHARPQRYLLPDALPTSEPDYEVWPNESLRFRFQYNILPADFIPRLIVEAHRILSDKPTWWRTGVVLKAEHCLVLVRADLARNRIEIQVKGTTGRREALSVVRHYFDAVHHYYAKLPFEARVPLPDQPEESVGYEHLIRLEREESINYRFLPERANHKYSVRELLEGVREDARRLRRRLGKSEDASSRSVVGAAASRHPPSTVNQYRGKIDFGILTIREDENRAVLSRFPKVVTEEQQRRYRIRRLSLARGGAYTLAVLRCVEQGTTDALQAARDLLEDLAPKFILVVGIAGCGPSSELSLGDVVVSNRIIDLSVEAVLQGQEREYAPTGGPLHPKAARIAADISAMITDRDLGDWNSPEVIRCARPPIDLGDDQIIGDPEWQRAVRQSIARRHRNGAVNEPRASAGAIASSDRLIRDYETMRVWQKVARQVVAVEMESAGIYKAVHGRDVPFLAIRGISDVIGLRRDPEWTTYACETAAAFAHALLLTRPFEPTA